MVKVDSRRLKLFKSAVYFADVSHLIIHASLLFLSSNLLLYT